MSTFKSLKKRAITASILLAWIVVGFYTASALPLVALCGILWALIAYDEWPRLDLSYWWFCLYPTLSILALIALSIWYRPLLVYLLLVICGHDTGAYFAGHWWGKQKLAPTISPGKTWEGVVGGIFFSYLCAGIWQLIAGSPFSTPEFIILTFVLNILGVIGDLFESYLKRRVGIKDSGAALPGHGGALDRLDSLLFTAPILLIYILTRSP